MKIKGIFNLILNILFPKRCEYCGKVQGFAANCSCNKQSDINWLAQNRIPASNFALHKHIKEVYAAASYAGLLRQMIIRYKFYNEQALSTLFADFLYEIYVLNDFCNKFDIIVPCPISEKTMKKRGYNQSALVAKLLSEKTKTPYAQAITKTVNTAKQMTLNREKRLVNLSNAFTANINAVKGLRVLIIDDIVTTGSTLNEAARALYAADAAYCAALCIAYTEKSAFS